MKTIRYLLLGVILAVALSSCAVATPASTPDGTATAVEQATPASTATTEAPAGTVAVQVASVQADPGAPTVGVAVTTPRQTSDNDALVVAAIAAIVGGVVSYLLNTIPALRQLYEGVPSGWKPAILLVIFILGAVALSEANCFNIYTSPVTCAAEPRDFVRLVFLGFAAFGGSQLAHGAGGGADLAAAAVAKEGNAAAG